MPTSGLYIETSTLNCSVGISIGNKIVSLREQSDSGYIHAEKLHVFISEVLSEAKLKGSDLDFIAVGIGPGSYTGLRIGVSAAKGLAYSLSKPIIGIKSLENLTQVAIQNNNFETGSILMPMLDARRMEVYTQSFDHYGNEKTEISAFILDDESIQEFKDAKHILFGDGAEKFKEHLKDDKFQFLDIKYPSVQAMPSLALERYKKENFLDVAYFEPYYFKDFVALKPKKLLKS